MGKLANATVNAEADAFAALCNGGSMDVYNDPVPATADTAITTQTLLCSIPLDNPAFDAAVAGVATLKAVTPTAVAAAGTASWARIKTSAGATVADVTATITGGGGDVELSKVVLGLGDTLDIVSFTYTRPKS